MPPVLFYLLKFSISLGVIWIFYWVFLRRLTFYSWNRWYLLIYSLLCLGIPFINITPWIGKQERGGEPVFVRVIPVLRPYHPEGGFTQPDGWAITGGVLLAGALFFSVRLLVRLASLRKIRRGARIIHPVAGQSPDGGSGGEPVIYHVDAPIVPFSFGRSIYINQHQHTEKEWEQIILHEYVHVKQRHTTDIMLGECLCIVNWYNPFAWLIRFAIRQNLEFIADRKVLEKGSDRTAYQYHLLQVIGAPAYRIANHFNFSSLKKRIIMMNSLQSARVNLLRFLFILPLLAVLLLAFRDRFAHSAPRAGHRLAGQTAYRGSSMSFRGDTIPASGKKDAPAHELILLNGIEIPRGTTVNDLRLSADEIDSMNILKGKDAMKLYGEKGRNGVIAITLKKDAATGKTSRDVLTFPGDSSVYVTVRPLTLQWADVAHDTAGPAFGSGRGAQPLIFIDGAKMEGMTRTDLRVRGVDFKSVSVLKGTDAVNRYGEEGRNGVIEISTKIDTIYGQPVHRDGKMHLVDLPASAMPGVKITSPAAPLPADSDRVVIRGAEASGDFRPARFQSFFTINHIPPNILIYIDGKEESSKTLEELDPNQIQSLSIFKEGTAMERFGGKGKNGAVLIETKVPGTPGAQEQNRTR